MTADAETRGPAARALSALRGGSTPALPARVHEDVARQQDRSEQIISVVQIVIVVLFGGLFLLAPDGGNTELAFELTPWVLGGYLVFSVLRFWASCRTRLPGWFLTLSVIADMFLLMVLIWSFHRTYQPPPPFYLKAPTLLYVFIFIALRALRFDARYVQLAGVTAIVGWSMLVLYAAAFEAGEMTFTRNYVDYITGNTILLGAEFDKLITIGVVTSVLAAVVEGDGAAVGRERAHDHLRGGRLAAAGLTHEAEAFAPCDFEADIVDGEDRARGLGAEIAALADQEFLGDSVHLEERRAGGGLGPAVGVGLDQLSGLRLDLAQRDEALALGQAEARDGVEQCLEIGMSGVAVDVLDASALHHLAAEHDHHFLGDVGDDAQVMGDHEDGHVELGLEVLDEFQNLGPDRDVERGRRLVGNE